MKRKLFAIAAGIVVLAAPIAGMQAFAQSPFSNQFPVLEGLDLTSPQKDHLAQMRTQVQRKIAAILTSDQQAKLKAAIAQKQGLRQAIASLNLTLDQKTQLRQIFQASRQQFSSILTPGQKQQLRQNIEQRHPKLAELHNQIKRVLTPEQQTQLKASLESGQTLKAAIASLNLSADQKVQLQTILQSARQQFDKRPAEAGE